MKLNTIIVVLFSLALAHAKLVMVIRHGEKINDNYTDLSPKGKARAFCLVNVFGNNGTYVSPQKIYAQSPTEKKPSTRPRDTVILLAEALGLQVDLSFTSGKITKLTSSIKNSTEEIILVSWNNDKIPEIAKKFGIVNPPNWGSKVFDDVWMIYDNSTATYLKNSLTKRDVYQGTDGYSMEIVKQNIKECISANTINFQNISTSDASKLPTGILMTIASLIICIFINS